MVCTILKSCSKAFPDLIFLVSFLKNKKGKNLGHSVGGVRMSLFFSEFGPFFPRKSGKFSPELWFA